MSADISIREADMTVDHVTLAQGCGIARKSMLQLIRDHKPVIEEAFGVLRFENAKPQKVGGRPERIAYLTEDQATFIVTLCQNTKPVVKFKAALVSAFAEAKRRLAEVVPTQEQIDRYLSQRYFVHTRPACEYGSATRDGRPRTGWRRPTFTVSRNQETAAREVAAALLVMQQYLPGFQLQVEGGK